MLYDDRRTPADMLNSAAANMGTPATSPTPLTYSQVMEMDCTLSYSDCIY